MRIKFWEEDTRILIIPYPDLTEDQPGTETEQYRGTSGVIQSVKVDEFGNIIADIYVAEEALTDLLDREPWISEHRQPLYILPDVARTGLEFRIAQFQARDLSYSVITSDPHPKDIIVRALLGMGDPVDLIEDDRNLVTTMLNTSQQRVLRCLNGNTTILFQQAPAGTGKTFVIAAYVKERLQTLPPSGAMLVTATTNAAVANLADAILTLQPDLSRHTLLFMQSLTAEKRHADGPATRDQYRLPEILDDAVQHNLITNSTDLHFARRYIARRLSHDGRPDREDRALKLVLSIGQYKIFVMTIAMAENLHRVLWPFITHCIIDEAGLVPDAELYGLASSLPELQQLFLTGDAKELPAYKDNILDNIVPYGFMGAVQTIMRRQTVPIISLDMSYRAHPVLTRCLSSMSYENTLVAAIECGERLKMVTSPLPLPTQHVPLLVLHLEGADDMNFLRSRHNAFPELAAQAITTKLLETVSPQDIVALCFYSATRDALRDILADSNISVHTVDGFQGKEAAVVILVTTRIISDQAPEDTTRFFLDEQRITVALSRARDGLIIIGDILSLIRSPSWITYLSEVVNDSPIVDLRYIDLLRADEFARAPSGLLLDSDGYVITSAVTSELSDKWLEDAAMTSDK